MSDFSSSESWNLDRQSAQSEMGRIGLLSDLLMGVLKNRAPQVAVWFNLKTLSAIPLGKAASSYLQALSIWFQLLRIAEECESAYAVGDYAGKNDRAGNDEESVGTKDSRPLMGQTSIGPTITAHPTEAKRVTVLEIHRRIFRALENLERSCRDSNERNNLLETIVGEIDLLWLTGELRLERPTLEDEIEWGLQFFRDSLFDAVPKVLVSLSSEKKINANIAFHSWIGGDRDGNPNVTCAMTRLAMQRGRETATEFFIEKLKQLGEKLSISALIKPIPEPQATAMKALADRIHDNQKNKNEPFRQAASGILYAVQNNLYQHPRDFIKELCVLEDGLNSIDAQLLAKRLMRPLQLAAKSFGFRTTTLDIRQNATVTNRVLADIWGCQESVDDKQAVPTYGSAQWSKRLRHELSSPELPAYGVDGLGEESRDLLSLLELMHETRQSNDPKAIGPFILSMTKTADDLLGVFLLGRYAGYGSETLDLSVVPLFETIDDLRSAPATLSALLAVPLAKRSVKRMGLAMEIMLGYSDSCKDGGFFCSSWELDKAQRKIANTLRKEGLDVAFFHGRGGSVSRGGAPAGRAIAAQPANTVGGRLRVTEQGETVSAQYANRTTAMAHLTLLAQATANRHEEEPENTNNAEHFDALEAISGLSQTAYVSLLNMPGFLDYFQEASPVNELSSLRIGSRPSRRFGGKSLEDLRAIPWVFSWTQNRHMLTGWFGFGTAFESFRKVRGHEGDRLLSELFEQSNLLRLIVDQIERSLYQADMGIARHYASLVEDQKTGQAIFEKINDEFQKSVEAILFLTKESFLADRFPRFKERFDRKRSNLDHINSLQVELLRAYRQDKQMIAVPVPLLQSMNALSAGIGWTG